MKTIFSLVVRQRFACRFTWQAISKWLPGSKNVSFPTRRQLSILSFREMSTSDFSEARYHQIADATLDEIQDMLGIIEPALSDEDVDINLSQGRTEM